LHNWNGSQFAKFSFAGQYVLPFSCKHNTFLWWGRLH
jgi:hypothetical protein